MTSAQYLSSIISLSMVLGFFATSRLNRLPSSVTILLTSIVLSLILVSLPQNYLSKQITNITIDAVKQGDFRALLIDGLLSFLLFAGAVSLPFEDIKKAWAEISVLAIISTLLSILLIGESVYFLCHYSGLSDMPRIGAYLFGALISPTDPVAVLGMIKTLNGPKSLSAKIAGESLFNDGVGIVVFLIIYKMLVANMAGVPLPDTASFLLTFSLDFIRNALGGILMGLLLAWSTQKIIIWEALDKFLWEKVFLMTLFIVTGGYTLANVMDVSGAIAMVVCGIEYSRWLKKIAKKQELVSFHAFWHIIDEIFNMIVYTFIGLEILTVNLNLGLAVFTFMSLLLNILIRYTSVFLPLLIIHPWRRFCLKTANAISWGGLKGGLALALALSVPYTEFRDHILAATYVIVCFSTIIQSLTMKYMISKE